MQRMSNLNIISCFEKLAKQTFVPKIDMVSKFFNQKNNKPISLGEKLTFKEVESIKEASVKTQENHKKFSAY